MQSPSTYKFAMITNENSLIQSYSTITVFKNIPQFEETLFYKHVSHFVETAPFLLFFNQFEIFLFADRSSELPEQGKHKSLREGILHKDCSPKTAITISTDRHALGKTCHWGYGND